MRGFYLKKRIVFSLGLLILLGLMVTGIGLTGREINREPGDLMAAEARWAATITVTDLFARLRHDTTSITFGHDQQCGDLQVVSTTYDSTFGYPTSAVYSYQQVSPANLGLGTYLRLYGGQMTPSCQANGPAVAPTIRATLQVLS